LHIQRPLQPLSRWSPLLLSAFAVTIFAAAALVILRTVATATAIYTCALKQRTIRRENKTQDRGAFSRSDTHGELLLALLMLVVLVLVLVLALLVLATFRTLGDVL
jgi:hypothetical protein